MWWDQTIDRWHGEGLPRELRFSQVFDIARYFGLDPYQQFWFSTTDATIEATQHHVEGMVSNMDDYLRIRPQLFPDHDSAIRGMSSWAARQERGEAVVWSTLEGFFWFPRTLMGFEKMMLCLRRMNRSCCTRSTRICWSSTCVCSTGFCRSVCRLS